MKTVNRENIREMLRMTCRHIFAVILAAGLLTGIAAAENSREKVRITWGGKQEVYDAQNEKDKEEALGKLQYIHIQAPGDILVIRNAEGDFLERSVFSDNIRGPKELKEMLASVGCPEPGKLFDEWNATFICVNYDCAPTGEYHLVSSKNEEGFVTEEYSIDPADRIVRSYWIDLEKAGRECSFQSWLSGNSDYSVTCDKDEASRVQAEDVSIPGMEKAMYIGESENDSYLVMCRPLENEVYVRSSPELDDSAGDKVSYGYVFFEFYGMTPEEVAELFVDEK